MITPSFFSTDPLVGAHINRYRQMLSGGVPVSLSQFINTYLQMKPLLHNLAESSDFDLSAIRYSATRLPEKIYQIKKVIISQNQNDFDNNGVEHDLKNIVESKNRRRLMFYDAGHQTLSCVINSDSDIDDLINLLLIYLVECRKIKKNLANPKILTPLSEIFFSEFVEMQNYFLANDFDPQIQLYPTPESVYISNCHQWWQEQAAQSRFLNLDHCPVYFVSSNSHSLINIIGGYINSKQNFIFDFIAHHHADIYQQWFSSKVEKNLYQVNDFLYYLSNEFLSDNPEYLNDKKSYETKLGVIELSNVSNFPVNTQIIPLKSLALSAHLDTNLTIPNRDKILNSSAVIVNVQYPLGIAAKYLLSEIIEYFTKMIGIYIIGKAAILNGSVGDIQIPDIVTDEITNNIYKFNNIFDHFFPFTANISQVLTHQKGACVYGTLLENKKQIENYRSSGFNIIEMESSNYLTALVENYILNKNAVSRSFYYSIDKLPVDFGIINYASDNPLTQNLGHESYEFKSIETTYLPTLTVLQRIINLETGVTP
jgi:hypothetical protein